MCQQQNLYRQELFYFQKSGMFQVLQFAVNRTNSMLIHIQIDKFVTKVRHIPIKLNSSVEIITSNLSFNGFLHFNKTVLSDSS